jgi:hypothetical protein
MLTVSLGFCFIMAHKCLVFPSQKAHLNPISKESTLRLRKASSHEILDDNGFSFCVLSKYLYNDALVHKYFCYTYFKSDFELERIETDIHRMTLAQYRLSAHNLENKKVDFLIRQIIQDNKCTCWRKGDNHYNTVCIMHTVVMSTL